MVDFLAANWIWIVLIGVMVAMHSRHGGHGGCGMHGHGGHREGERQRHPERTAQPDHAPVGHNRAGQP